MTPIAEDALNLAILRDVELRATESMGVPLGCGDAWHVTVIAAAYRAEKARADKHAEDLLANSAWWRRDKARADLVERQYAELAAKLRQVAWGISKPEIDAMLARHTAERQGGTA